VQVLKEALEVTITDIFGAAFSSADTVNDLCALLLKHTLKQLTITSMQDSAERFTNITSAVQYHLTTFIITHQESLRGDFDALSAIAGWTQAASTNLCRVFNDNRNAYFAKSDATPYLGAASKRMYNYVRGELNVPMHKGLVDHPDGTNGKETIGSNISIIYDAMRSGRLYKEMLHCLKPDP